ncbi:hypothetical protein F4861DRAFT_518732 [Xylaria intraflava]|nr:hypothetical protein F4861DRAFT_518732 [Xylaria intraflava]
MAPPSGPLPRPAGSASGHAKKQNPASAPPAVATTNRPNVVLPAIPLPYVNKRSDSVRTTATKSSHEHTPTASTSNDLAVSSLEAALLGHDPAHSTKDEVKSQNAEKQEGAAVPSVNREQQPEVFSQQVNGVDYTSAKPTAGASYGPGATQGTNGDLPYASHSKPAVPTTEKEFVATLPFHGRPLPHHQHVVDQHHHHAPFHAPHPHHMHPHQHAHQMSNGGGIMFGAPDSHSPSPAPLPGGFMPPPHPPMNGDHRGPPRSNGHDHNHSNNSGFPGPINTRFRENMIPISTMDGYGMMPNPAPPVHMDTYAPGAGRYGPPTPHSFHGSHTSGEPNGMENPPLPYHPSASYAHVHHEHSAAPHPPGAFPPFLPPQPMSRQFNIADDEAMGGVNYIRNLFDNPELADCVLELTFAKGLHPVKISAHKLILARSPALKQQILTARANDRACHTIAVESDDAYLRPDAWWSAVQYLYLYQHQLPQPHHPMLGNAGNGMDFAGDSTDQFTFCLGYATAGHILAMQDILIRGLEVAANTLTWDTIETGLGFVLENTIQRHFDRVTEPEEFSPSAFLEFGYGPETKILLAAIMNFLVTEFPPNFELDISVPDTSKIARIPMGAANMNNSTTTRTYHTHKAVPAIARGTTPRQFPRQVRLTSIKFGDLPPAYPDDGTQSQREPAKCSPILSLILLNLPYDQLCQVLTTGSDGVSSWNTAQDRYRAVAEVVAEREARRLRAVEAVRSGAVPHAFEIQSRLSAPHRFTIAEPWDVLNWREEVIHHETPRIIRRWVPQFDVAQQQPQQAPPLYNIPDSMV